MIHYVLQCGTLIVPIIIIIPCQKGYSTWTNTSRNNSFEFHLKFLWSGESAREICQFEDSSSMTTSFNTCRSGTEKHQPLVLKLPIFFKRGLNQGRFLHCPLLHPWVNYSGVWRAVPRVDSRRFHWTTFPLFSPEISELESEESNLLASRAAAGRTDSCHTVRHAGCVCFLMSIRFSGSKS